MIHHVSKKRSLQFYLQDDKVKSSCHYNSYSLLFIISFYLSEIFQIVVQKVSEEERRKYDDDLKQEERDK